MDVISQSIWERLTTAPEEGVNFSTSPIRQKDGTYKDFTYVNWMEAHVAMKNLYPDYTWEFEVNENGQHAFYYGDTAEVRCRMTIGGKTQVTTLPVYNGFTNEVVHNPTSDDINNAKQRCRVKAMAEWGLFYRLYLPQQSEHQLEQEQPQQEKAEEEPPAEEQPSDIDRLEELWSQQIYKCKAKNKTELNKFFKRFSNTLRNQGIEESDEHRKSREQSFTKWWSGELYDEIKKPKGKT